MSNLMNHLIRIGDFARLVEKLRQGYLPRLRQMLSLSSAARTEAAWAHTSHPAKHWGSIPAVRARWNHLITGDPEVEPAAYVAQKYLHSQTTLLGLSVGCGTGGNELRWARTGCFARIDGFDLAPPRIDEARRQAEAAGLTNRVHFFVSDMARAALAPEQYDVVIAENALHHFNPLQEAIRKLQSTLRSGGYLVVRDFVGPSRFQWSPRQIEAVNGLLNVLPSKYRRRWQSGTLKRRFHTPGRLSMMISDPSEAAASASIIPLLNEHFGLVERRDFGGTLLQLLFDDIAHHFLHEDEETAAWLEFCFRAEDLLLAHGDLPSDFVFAVFQKR